MRLVTFRRGAGSAPGVVLDGGEILDLHAAPVSGGRPRSVVDLLAFSAAWLDRVRRLIDEVEHDRSRAAERGWLAGSPPGGIELLPPMGAGVLIVATSGNFPSHLAEMGLPAPPATTGFIVSPNSLVGTGAAIRLPPGHADMVDWEGELGIVLGRPCHRVGPAEAARCVAGYTLFNDVSARDWVARTRSADSGHVAGARLNNILFKQFPTFGPIGPQIVTVDEVCDPAALVLTTTVNGQVMQRDTIGNLRFGLGEIISQLSQVYSFAPGDIITTGTPAGVGIARHPPTFLRPGDEVIVRADRIGALANPVLAPES